MFAVDTKTSPIEDLPSFVWCSSVSGVEEIEIDWAREMEYLDFPCPELPREKAEEVFATLEEFGQARLTFFIPGHPEYPAE